MAELIRINDNEIAQKTGHLVAEALRRILDKNGSARLAISGGSAADAVATIREELGASWRKVSLTWVDERCVDFDDEDSNRGQAHRSRALADDSPPAFELPLWCDGETPDDAVSRVESSLKREFRGTLDVVLLGMGEDGHIASLFPGHPALNAHPDELVRYITDSPKPPPRRLTLTRPLLQTAESTFLLAKGDSKREALLRLLSGDQDLPAIGLPRLTILTTLDLETS